MLHEHLRAEGLVAEADGISRLHHMDFCIASGETVGLIGLSGAGKSTLAETLCGEVTAEGRVWLRGQSVTAQQLAQSGALIRRTSRLLENLTVTDNLLALSPPEKQSGLLYREKAQRERCAALLAAHSMEHFLDVPVRWISPSAQHRLLMLRAVAQGKTFLALDHLCDGCTMQEQSQLAECIRHLSAQGLTILYITGHIDYVLRQMDRITVMRNGRRAKELRRGEYAESTLSTYVYGYHKESTGPAGSPRPSGEPFLTMDGIPIHSGGLTVIHDADGSAGPWLERLRQATDARISVLTADDLSGSWIASFSPLENLLLLAAPRMSHGAFHVPRAVCRVLRQECAAETGLTERQLDEPFSRRKRLERFRLLLYREQLKKSDLCVFTQMTAGADFQDREGMLQLIGRLPGTILYLSSDFAELERLGGDILSLSQGQLQQEAP